MNAARFDYFLTYARSDAAAARELVERLEGFGIRIGCDFREGGLREGESWIPQLEALLLRSDSYLILVGERELNRWVLAELEVALDRNANSPSFRIVPLLLPGISPADLPSFLGRFEVVLLAEDWRLAGSVSLARLIARLRPAEKSGAEICPFPGLRAFDAAMAAYFFGRSHELQQLLRLLGQTPSGHVRWLQIEGASGSGKSSLAQAGLLPAIEGGLLAGAPPTFRRLAFRPGRQPVRSLAQALHREFAAAAPGLELRSIEETLARDEKGLLYLVREHAAAGQGFLILVDQLEELFSLAAGDLEPARQLGALLAAALEDADGPLYLLTTIRSDFLSELAKLPELVRHLNGRASRFLLPEIAAKGLAEAVRQPALLAGLSWESESLPERIVEDAGLSPGSLPLVAHVLAEMWERDHRRGVLTHETYDRLGGVGGALARSADSLLESLGERDRAVARKMLLGLVQLQPGGHETRRVLPRAELLAAAGDGAALVLARLSGSRDPRAPEDAPPPPRLVAVGAEGSVELVHEALLRNWQSLRLLIEENRQALACRNDVENAARAWDAAGRPEEGLPRGKQLAYFRKAELVGVLGRELLAASEALEERKRRLQREQTRSLRMLGGIGIAILLALLGVLAVNYEEIYAGFVEQMYVEGLGIGDKPTANELKGVDAAEKALEILGAPGSDAHRLLRARLEIARGVASLELDLLDEAEAHFERASGLAEAASPGEISRPGFLFHACAGRGQVQIRRHRIVEAAATVEQAAAILESIPPSLGRVIFLSPMIELRIRLASGLAAGGEPAAALGQLEKALVLRQALADDPIWHENGSQMLFTLAFAYNEVGQQAHRRGDAETAWTALERAVELNEKGRPLKAALAFARQQAIFLDSLVIVARQRNDLRRAREALERIPELFAATDFMAYPSDRATVMNAWLGLADVDYLDNRRDLSRQRLASAGAFLDRLAGLPAAGVAAGELELGRAQVEFRLGHLDDTDGRPEEAWTHLDKACRLGATVVRLDPAAAGWRYQQLTCLDRLARLASRQGWTARLAATLAEAGETWRGYPSPETLQNDPALSFLLPRLRKVP